MWEELEVALDGASVDIAMAEVYPNSEHARSHTFPGD
jgi:hypothetical protein